MTIRSIIGGAGCATLATAALLALGGSTALAHVGTDKDEVAAGGSTTLTFSIGHGCEGSPTNSMKFQIPAAVMNAAPVVKPGWTIETESEGTGESERTAAISFTAQEGFAVEDGFRDNFTLAFAAPDDEGVLFFKVVQGCEQGENPWIDEWDGTGDEPEHPAPSVMVVAGASTDHHGNAEVGEASGDDDSSSGLAIVALVVGALGLVTGAFALVRSRSGGKPPVADESPIG